jgi:MFS family permease
MNHRSGESRYRWYVLILAALTNTVTIAIPSMCISVLFKEISAGLDLSLVQVGLVWGIGSLPGVVTVLLGGMIGDRFGPRRVLIFGCLLAGLAGALRGFALDFFTLAAAMFLFGFITPAISMNTLKTCGMWFSRRQLGLANGALSMGMALGFMIGSLISATFLSPLLGGWRNVLVFYGVIAMAFCIPWYFVRVPEEVPGTVGSPRKVYSFRQSMGQVVRIRNVWLLGLAILGVGGCIQGTLGYLPSYLRDQGWVDASADGPLASFHLISLICVIPIALLSDRVGSRRTILLAATLSIALGVGLLSFVNGGWVWPAVLMAGMVRDGFMVLFMTMIFETEGVGTTLVGTATGFAMVFSGLGSLFAPAIGNSLASTGAGSPFLFWAALTGVGLFGIGLAREKKTQKVLAEA